LQRNGRRGRQGFIGFSLGPAHWEGCGWPFLLFGVIKLNEGEVLERCLVREWGLPRHAFVDFRKAHLVKPADWDYRKDVVLTASGLAKMQRHFGLEEGAEKEPMVFEGVVVRWNWRNSRMVEVRDDDGQKRIVRVRNAMLWRPDRQGQFMRIKFFRDGDQWRQTGRSPRYPGIW